MRQKTLVTCIRYSLLGLCMAGGAVPTLAEESEAATQAVANPAGRLLSTPSPQRSRGYVSLRYGRSFFKDAEFAAPLEFDAGSGAELLSAAVGFNWGRYFGLELAADYYESDVLRADQGKVGEYTIYDIIPQVRLRYPLLEDRLTPYLIAGAGLGFTEDNDVTLLGTQTVPRLRSRDTSVVYAVGGGLEYFLADNIAIGLEAKYIDHEAEIELDQVARKADHDAVLLSAGLRLFFPGPPKAARNFSSPPSGAGWLLDANELRPYIQLRLGEAFPDNASTPVLKFTDHEHPQLSAFTVGMDLSRYWGVEVAADNYESDVNNPDGVKVGEYSVWSFVPQARIRYPLYGDRLVPYALGGVGVGLTQANDQTPQGALAQFVANDLSLVGVVGIGIEYFIADNIALGVESKYLFHDSEAEIGGVRTEFDLDPILLSAGLRIFYP